MIHGKRHCSNLERVKLWSLTPIPSETKQVVVIVVFYLKVPWECNINHFNLGNAFLVRIFVNYIGMWRPFKPQFFINLPINSPINFYVKRLGKHRIIAFITFSIH